MLGPNLCKNQKEEEEEKTTASLHVPYINFSPTIGSEVKYFWCHISTPTEWIAMKFAGDIEVP